IHLNKLETCCVLVVHILTSLVTDDPHSNFPQMYNLDNVECGNNTETFCEIGFTVVPKQSNSKLWEKISETQNHNFKFRKDRIYRSMCVPRKQENNLNNYVKEKLYTEIKNKTFKVIEVDLFNCKGDYPYLPEDYFLLYCIAGYVTFVLLATYYDYSVRKGDYTLASVGWNKYIVAFSLITSNKKLRKPINNKFYDQLKSIQGIRTYNMMLVISGHSIMNYMTVMVSNPEFLEKIFELASPFFTWGMFLVQPFFLFSGWLIMFYFLENEGKLKLHHFVMAFVYRLLRLWPPLAFSILLHRSRLLLNRFSGAQTFLMELDYKACSGSWWNTFFFMTNYQQPQKMCNIISWYLGADTQNFLAALIVLYVIFKFKLPVLRSLVFTVVVCIITQMWIMYLYDLDVIYRVTPENFLLYNILVRDRKSLFLWYLSPLSNTPSFFLGLIFATIYYRYNNAKIFQKQIVKLLWFVCFAGIPLLSIFLSIYHYDKFTTVFLGSILKPMYSLGIAIGVLGMTQGIGGFIKKICEFRVLQILAQTTYTVYLFHLVLVFDVLLNSTSLVNVTVSKIVYLCAVNVVRCFILGFVLCHFVELPWNNILSIFMKPSSDRKNK
ncbi:unnamed protein product, partial [Brassicogethes aeneus]